jgi:hypothetical protein
MSLTCGTCRRTDDVSERRGKLYAVEGGDLKDWSGSNKLACGFLSNSGTFCVPGMNHPGSWTGVQFRDCPGQSGTVGKPIVVTRRRANCSP